MNLDQLIKRDRLLLEVKDNSKIVGVIGCGLLCASTIFVYSDERPEPIKATSTEVESIIGQYWIA